MRQENYDNGIERSKQLWRILTKSINDSVRQVDDQGNSQLLIKDLFDSYDASQEEFRAILEQFTKGKRFASDPAQYQFFNFASKRDVKERPIESIVKKKKSQKYRPLDSVGVFNQILGDQNKHLSLCKGKR